LGLLAAACGGDGSAVPTAPIQTPAFSTPAPPPVVFAERYTQITLGEVVKGRVNADDPMCDAWQCQYFRLTAPSDGRLIVTLTSSIGTSTGGINLDLVVTDPEGREWWQPSPVQAKGGVTYQIAILEYESPGVEFELRTSLEPN
jgi:hypothetical protein